MCLNGSRVPNNYHADASCLLLTQVHNQAALLSFHHNCWRACSLTQNYIIVSLDANQLFFMYCVLPGCKHILYILCNVSVTLQKETGAHY